MKRDRLRQKNGIFTIMLIIFCFFTLLACEKDEKEDVSSDSGADTIMIGAITDKEPDDVEENINDGKEAIEETIEADAFEEEKVVKNPAPDEFVELEEVIDQSGLYTDPILMNPEDNEVTVVWFTEEEGEDNRVLLFDLGDERKPTRRVNAETLKLSRIRGGKKESNCDEPSIKRDIFRHEARVALYDEQDELSYCVATDNIASESFTIKREPKAGDGMKILLTSDHQLKNMCAANIQKVYETVGPVDLVLANGDIVDVPDRAYDWFDSDNAFFRVMQGRADHKVGSVSYKGAPIIQNAPIFTSIGNHDVMGEYSDSKPLSYQFNNPKPYDYNTITWEEIFDFPVSENGGEKYYAFTYGDIRVIALEVARVWRLPNIGLDGKYSEIPGVDESKYGYGQFIFEPIKKGSAQYEFLEKELKSEEYQAAKYHIVMYHFDSHSLGGNTIPAYTDPVAKQVTSPITGQNMIIYDYPIEEDYLIKDVEPLLEENGVDLLFTAHSHLWNRFVTEGGINILQTSNVGNTYDAFLDGAERTLMPSAFMKNDPYYAIKDEWNADNYIMSGDPGGLEPIYPNVSPLPGDKPYLASNTITAFSIIDTAKGTIDSYYFDTEKPDSEVVLFDSFEILRK